MPNPNPNSNPKAELNYFAGYIPRWYTRPKTRSPIQVLTWPDVR